MREPSAHRPEIELIGVEPGASIGLAALLETQVPPAPDRATVLVITRGNLDPEQVSQYL